MDREICYFNYNSKQINKCNVALKLIRFLAVSNLFPLDVVQKCQRYQLCVWGKTRGKNIDHMLEALYSKNVFDP